VGCFLIQLLVKSCDLICSVSFVPFHHWRCFRWPGAKIWSPEAFHTSGCVSPTSASKWSPGFFGDSHSRYIHEETQSFRRLIGCVITWDFGIMSFCAWSWACLRKCSVANRSLECWETSLGNSKESVYRCVNFVALSQWKMSKNLLWHNVLKFLMKCSDDSFVARVWQTLCTRRWIMMRLQISW
jgi:hypothetical protein